MGKRGRSIALELLDCFQHYLSCFGQAHAAWLPLEQRGTKLFFELLDLAGDCGRRNMQVVGSSTD
ncbi:hypothetical protein BN2476_2560002 [Paraburkholderia piptadeniae]|uniref:Uncharacterized protein n=1 Tax=Paraburkholderia piptadeniae TaxID=1701573 RepID=A0A1N7SXW1_9BURK|nr:hypothetical protein BN2476_2560002 [Paraburkholderia piptadeniae]